MEKGAQVSLMTSAHSAQAGLDIAISDQEGSRLAATMSAQQVLATPCYHWNSLRAQRRALAARYLAGCCSSYAFKCTAESSSSSSSPTVSNTSDCTLTCAQTGCHPCHSAGQTRTVSIGRMCTPCQYRIAVASPSRCHSPSSSRSSAVRGLLPQV